MDDKLISDLAKAVKAEEAAAARYDSQPMDTARYAAWEKRKKTRESIERRIVAATASVKVKGHDLEFAGYQFTSNPSGTTVRREYVDTARKGDYGADPIGDGSFRMVPSGDIVDFEERTRRLSRSK